MSTSKLGFEHYSKHRCSLAQELSTLQCAKTRIIKDGQIENGTPLPPTLIPPPFLSLVDKFIRYRLSSKFRLQRFPPHHVHARGEMTFSTTWSGDPPATWFSDLPATWTRRSCRHSIHCISRSAGKFVPWTTDTTSWAERWP